MSQARLRSAFLAAICTAFLVVTGWVLPGVLQISPTRHVPPTAAIVQNNIGVGYMNQYLFAEAAKAFRKALSEDGDFNLARINTGIALLYDEDLDEAGKILEDALSRDPRNPYGLFCLGLALKNKGEIDRAIENFRKLTEIDGKYAPAHYNLGVLYARVGKSAEAEISLKRTLELEPNNTSALYNLGTLVIKEGRSEEGNAILKRFRDLQSKGESVVAGTAYGEMGEYALALDYKPHLDTAAAVAKQPAPNRPFVDRSKEAGLSGLGATAAQATESWTFSAEEWNPEFLRTHLLPNLGGGIALADLDGDGDIDAVVTRYNRASKTWESFILLNDGKGHFTDATADSGLRNSGAQISAAIGDYDNDGLPDVLLVGMNGNTLFRNLGQAKFKDVTAAAGVGDGGLSVSATFVDYDHDGDLDLYVSHLADVSAAPSGAPLIFPDSLPGERNRMFRNNGNGTFTEYAETLGIGGGRLHHLGMIPSDVDNDRDIDLVALNWKESPQLFSNDRQDRFSEISRKAGLAAEGEYHTLTIADYNRDGWMDLFLAPARAGSNLLLVNRRDGTFERYTHSGDFLRSLPSARYGSGSLDWDNDGNMDLYVLRGDGAELWENQGDGTFVHGGDLPCPNGRAAAGADFNGDGRVDILCLDGLGGIHFLANESGNANHWLGIQLQGLRSNKFGFGAKVEVRGGQEYQKMEVQGHNGFLSQDSPILWIGLGQATQADSVTVRWPSGILQSEINVKADRIVRIKELDRKGTSCPLLYAWDGGGFQFVTDFLGGCAIGYMEAPGRYSVPDTDEYVKIEGSQLRPREGKLLLNLNNQLEEVIMFDQAQLVVADHPEGTEIYPNERLMPAPPYPEFKVYTTREAKPPAFAFDEKGNDILPLVSRLDRTYPADFRSLPFKGYAESHSITLDLGPLQDAARVLLLLDGWIDYADSSSNLAAAQAGLSQIPPYLQVKDARGKWTTVMDPMGFPAGLPKTMVVDLTGKFLCGDHQVRIVTNMKIYWDRIRVESSPQEPVRLTRLNPSSAFLHFRGFPKYYSPDGRLPWVYDYSEIAASELWGTHAGAYTRFGDVRELLARRDDRFVITRNGDEISLAFDADTVPPLRQGWTRDYLLYADGYGKDMDLNSLYADAIGPLPFHAMSRFPYGLAEHYPDDQEHRRYQRQYNTRIYPDRTDPTDRSDRSDHH